MPDVRPHLWAGSAYLCPMTGGSGVKNKLMEAMAAGCPCAVTPRAAFGLGVIGGEHLLLGERAEELARQTSRVLNDDSISAALAETALRRIDELSWSAAAQAYEQIYAEVIAETVAQT